MREIDGKMGEGGGQVLRTSLALSLVKGEPIKLVDIRGGRERPGLLRQHLCAVRLAAEVGHAEVIGDEPGSRELIFRPRKVAFGNYSAAVGTAGSTTLVLQTVLPALLLAKGKSTLILEGGTHNPLAPPFDFLARAFLPLIEKMGPRISISLERHGFYPAGGGRIRVEIEPSETLSHLVLRERGGLRSQGAVAMVAGLSRRIAERELIVLAQRLGWSEDSLRVEELAAAAGPGNVLSAVVESENVTEVFTGFGEKQLSAERVAEKVAREVRSHLTSGAPVGTYLADQLLLPFALAKPGSVLRTGKLSRHAETQLQLLRELIGAPLEVRDQDGQIEIACGAA